MTNIERAERAKKRRDARRLDRRCIQCNAGLQDDDVVLCVECVEIRAASRQRYEERNPHRNKARKSPISDEIMLANASKKRARYAKRVNNGDCAVDGCKMKALPGKPRCRACLLRGRIASRDCERRKVWPRILARNLWRAAVWPLRTPSGKLPEHLRVKKTKPEAEQERMAA